MANQPTAQLFYIGVKALIQSQDKKILLLHSTPRKNLGGISYWDLPGGRVNNETNIHSVLRRECQEELGDSNLEIGALFGFVIANHRATLNQSTVKLGLIVYKCQLVEQTIQLSDEHDQFDWFDSQKAAELLEAKYPKDFTAKIAYLP